MSDAVFHNSAVPAGRPEAARDELPDNALKNNFFEDAGGVLRLTLLYDFYGELLTARQRECFELHILGDMSLNETAEALGITPQGVADIVGRAKKALTYYEQKLGLIKRHGAQTAAAEEAFDFIAVCGLKQSDKSEMEYLITRIINN